MSRFEEVDDQYEAHEVEDRVFDHWEEVDAYEKTKKNSSPSARCCFVFS